LDGQANKIVVVRRLGGPGREYQVDVGLAADARTPPRPVRGVRPGVGRGRGACPGVRGGGEPILQDFKLWSPACIVPAACAGDRFQGPELLKQPSAPRGEKHGASPLRNQGDGTPQGDAPVQLPGHSWGTPQVPPARTATGGKRLNCLDM